MGNIVEIVRDVEAMMHEETQPVKKVAKWQPFCAKASQLASQRGWDGVSAVAMETLQLNQKRVCAKGLHL